MVKGYKVLKIDELTKVGDLHGIEKYYRYTIKTDGGTVISVNINEADSTPEKAAPILLKRATELDATMS